RISGIRWRSFGFMRRGYSPVRRNVKSSQVVVALTAGSAGRHHAAGGMLAIAEDLGRVARVVAIRAAVLFPFENRALTRRMRAEAFFFLGHDQSPRPALKQSGRQVFLEIL